MDVFPETRHKEDLIFDYNGIYPFDKNRIMIFGSLTIGGGSVRSTLLLSEDGGKNWKEEMQPVLQGDIYKIYFIDKYTGWALVLRGIASDGDAELFQTKNSGRS